MSPDERPIKSVTNLCIECLEYSAMDFRNHDGPSHWDPERASTTSDLGMPVAITNESHSTGD
jgi:hypothetical protein